MGTFHVNFSGSEDFFFPLKKPNFHRRYIGILILQFFVFSTCIFSPSNKILSGWINAQCNIFSNGVIIQHCHTKNLHAHFHRETCHPGPSSSSERPLFFLLPFRFFFDGFEVQTKTLASSWLG